MNFFRKIEIKLRRIALSPKHWIRKRATHCDIRLRRLGTSYGGWTFVDTPKIGFLPVLLCGAGEDISFDLALQREYGCEVYIVDPTPRAIKHFKDTIEYQKNISPNSTIKLEYSSTYNKNRIDLSKIKLAPVAIWTDSEYIKFWQPEHDHHVSHSIVNNQNTNNFITVRAETIFEICRYFCIDPYKLSIIKLDIEGAEIKVLNWLLDQNIYPEQYLVEFDELNIPKTHSSKAVKDTINRLIDANYKLVYFDGGRNCTFYRYNEYD